jgi:GntR family transcriptional regulator, transcriptional repressor for pyruvate dehydrogenase complex
MSDSTLTQKTVERILGLIEKEGLGRNDFLPTEAVLLKRFGVSRIILREALSYLKGLGLLQSRRGSGFRIVDVDFVETFIRVLRQVAHFQVNNPPELLELRRMLEIGAIDKAISNATEEDIEEIERLQRSMQELIETPGSTHQDYHQADMRFHEAITRPAGCRLLNELNRVICIYYTENQDSVDFSKALDQTPGIERTAREHAIIANAFRLREPEIGFACLRSHLHPILQCMTELDANDG